MYFLRIKFLLIIFLSLNKLVSSQEKQDSLWFNCYCVGGQAVIQDEILTYDFHHPDSILWNEDIIKKLVFFFKDNTDIVVRIDIFNDTRGSSSVNLKLTQEKAQKIKSKLIEIGIPSDRFKVNGKGENCPIFESNFIDKQSDKEIYHQANRRIEITILSM